MTSHDNEERDASKEASEPNPQTLTDSAHAPPVCVESEEAPYRSWSRFFDRQYKRTVARLVKNGIPVAIAEDAALDALIAIFQYLSNSAGCRNIEALISRAALNKAIDLLRKQKREGSKVVRVLTQFKETMSASFHSLDPEAEVILRDRQKRILHALNCLPEKQRTAVYLRIFEEMTFPEIADQEGSTTAAVTSNFWHGIQTLRGRFSDQND